MEKVYETVILGASLFSLGYAHTHKDCLILEATEALGGEFVTTFRPVAVDNGYKSTFASAALTGFEADTHMLQPVLCRYASENEINIILLATVTEVSFNDGLYSIRYHGNSGFRTVSAKKLIDTTAYGVFNEYLPLVTDKTLRAVCRSGRADFTEVLKTELPCCGVVKTAYEGEYIALFTFNKETDISLARKTVIEGFKAAFSSDSAAIAVLAFSFDPSFTENTGTVIKSDKSVWIPQIYQNPLKAFDCGCEYGREML